MKGERLIRKWSILLWLVLLVSIIAGCGNTAGDRAQGQEPAEKNAHDSNDSGPKLAVPNDVVEAWASKVPDGLYILIPTYLPFDAKGFNDSSVGDGYLKFSLIDTADNQFLFITVLDAFNMSFEDAEGTIDIDGRTYNYTQSGPCSVDLWERSGEQTAFMITGAYSCAELPAVLKSMVRVAGTSQASMEATNATEEEPDESAAPHSASPEPTASASSSSSSEAALLEQFGREYDEAARREDWEDTYSMLDESSQQMISEREWTEGQQAIRGANGPPAPLESVSVEQNEEVSDSLATVTLHYEDGTQKTMKAMVPMVVEDPSDSGVPKRFLTDAEVSNLKQSSFAPSESTPSASYGQSTEEMEAEVAAGEYYRAVGVGDWGYTYDHLDSSTQSKFTRDEWFQKNEFLAGDGSTIYYIDSVQRLGGTSEPTVEVTVRLTFGDGSTSVRNTYFVYEDGSWKHRFSQEEYDLLMPDASYDEFVQAQQ